MESTHARTHNLCSLRVVSFCVRLCIRLTLWHLHNTLVSKNVHANGLSRRWQTDYVSPAVKRLRLRAHLTRTEPPRKPIVDLIVAVATDVAAVAVAAALIG